MYTIQMSIYEWVFLICWVVFLVYWMISAVSSKRNARRNYNWFLLRVLLLLIILGLFHWPVFSEFYQQEAFASSSIAFSILGDVLCVLGISLAIWARVYLGRNWGVPMSVKVNPELVTSGPYTFIRHPIYSGVLLAMIGSIFVEGIPWLVVLVLLGGYFIFAATREEKLMLKQFPDQYPQYKKRTKMLIPFVL
jgi:protein-S-isoprenylcysteine O-methyltransferase Ste14